MNVFRSKIVLQKEVMRTFRLRVLGLLFGVASAGTCLAAPEVSLYRVEGTAFDELTVASEIRLPAGRKIYIEDVPVSFDERWLTRYRNETSSGYQASIKKRYGATLKKLLVKELEFDGWTIVKTPAANNIILTPKLYDLYILAPSPRGIKDVIVGYAGFAGIELVFKSPKNQPFMKIKDYGQTLNSAGGAIVSNRATNFRYFRMLMSEWSKEASEYLDSVISIAEQASQKKKN